MSNRSGAYTGNGKYYEGIQGGTIVGNSLHLNNCCVVVHGNSISLDGCSGSTVYGNSITATNSRGIVVQGNSLTLTDCSNATVTGNSAHLLRCANSKVVGNNAKVTESPGTKVNGVTYNSAESNYRANVEVSSHGWTRVNYSPKYNFDNLTIRQVGQVDPGIFQAPSTAPPWTRHSNGSTVQGSYQISSSATASTSTSAPSAPGPPAPSASSGSPMIANLPKDYTEEESTDPAKECSVCMINLKKVALNCGHIFCVFCTQTLLAQTKAQRQCPDCRVQIASAIFVYF
jgi:hypothetical protein